MPLTAESDVPPDLDVPFMPRKQVAPAARRARISSH
jgi:hypothetical protein